MGETKVWICPFKNSICTKDCSLFIDTKHKMGCALRLLAIELCFKQKGEVK